MRTAQLPHPVPDALPAWPTAGSWWSRGHAAGGPSSGAWAEDLWNSHGQLVYSMACALLGDEAAAMRAVALGMVDFATSSAVTSADDTAHTLARHVYRRSTQCTGEATSSPSLPPAMVWLAQLAQHQRTSIALCAFGGFTYTDVAELLDTTPLAVAQLLSSGMDELSRLSRPAIVVS